jgi:hypothetical protein
MAEGYHLVFFGYVFTFLVFHGGEIGRWFGKRQEAGFTELASRPGGPLYRKPESLPWRKNRRFDPHSADLLDALCRAASSARAPSRLGGLGLLLL